MLGPIRAVTTTAADLDQVERAYSRFLGYRTAERGHIAPETAASWGAPKAAGRPYLAMIPESGEPTYLRFVEQPLPDDFRPLTSFGWNATEIVVQNSDLLAERLRDSPFQILFPPRELDGIPDIRAMQVMGPAHEILYLTWIKRKVTGFDLPIARSFVDRCFITVVGGRDMEAMRSFYRDAFGNQPRDATMARISVLSKANGLDPETKHGLATVPLGGGSLIEIDQYPTVARPRVGQPGELPPGMAIVTFEHPLLDSRNGHFITAPAPARLPPYRDHRTATLVGAAGELIELIEV